MNLNYSKKIKTHEFSENESRCSFFAVPVAVAIVALQILRAKVNICQQNASRFHTI